MYTGLLTAKQIDTVNIQGDPHYKGIKLTPYGLLISSKEINLIKVG